MMRLNGYSVNTAKRTSALPLIISLLAAGQLSLAGCGPTYPKDKVEESIKRLAKRDADIEVATRLIGKTLIVSFVLDDLLDASLRFSPEKGRAIEDVSLATRRVCLSTNLPVDFFVVVAQDVKASGGEFVMTSCLSDLKRLRGLNISRGEYFERLQRDLQLNPVILGEQELKKIFNPPIIIRTLESKRISKNEALFFVEAVENDIAYPYLCRVNTQSYPNSLKELSPAYDAQAQFDAEASWDKDPLNYEVKLPEFLATQIERRLKGVFQKDKNLLARYQLNFALGNYQNDNFSFVINVLKKDNTPIDKAAREDIYGACLEPIASVLHGYDFVDFREVSLINFQDLVSMRVDKERLEEFREKRLSLEALLPAGPRS